MKTREKHRVARRKKRSAVYLRRGPKIYRAFRVPLFSSVCAYSGSFAAVIFHVNEQKATARRTAHVPARLSVHQDLSLAYFGSGMPFPLPQSFAPGIVCSRLSSYELTLGCFRFHSKEWEWETVEARLRILSSKRRTEYKVFSNRWTVDDCEYRRNAKRRSKYIFLFTTYSLIGGCVETRRKVKTHIMVYNVFSNG